MVRRMKAFAEVNEISRGGMSVVVAAAFASSSAANYALMIWDPDEDGEAFPVVMSLAKGLRVMCATLNSFK